MFARVSNNGGLPRVQKIKAPRYTMRKHFLGKIKIQRRWLIYLQSPTSTDTPIEKRKKKKGGYPPTQGLKGGLL